MPDNVAIILVAPQGDANIGASARAMKNFGITDLRLVTPAKYLTCDAYSWAVSAKDVLENALVFSSLKEAMTDLSYTLAFTRRLGKSRRRSMDVREAASKAVSFLRRGKVGMIFGPEESGLSNREISMADEIVHIPTGAKLPSINLSQSVIIACHELFTSALANEVLHVHDTKETFATKKEVASTIAKLEETLEVLDYKDQKDYPIKTKIINQFNKLFGRAGLTKKDLSMFSGLFARIRKTRG